MRSIQKQSISKDFQKAVQINIKKQDSDEVVVQKVFESVVEHFFANRFLQFTKPSKIFTMTPTQAWQQGGAQACTVLNMVFCNALFATDRFNSENIRIRTTYIFINIHQYVEVFVNNKVICVDVWGYYFGIPYGSYARGWNPWRLKAV